MRLFFLSIFALCCGFVGVKIRDHYKRRKVFYTELVRFLRIVKEKISFKKEYLKDVLDSADNKDISNIICGKPDSSPIDSEEKKEIVECVSDLEQSSLSFGQDGIEKAIDRFDRKRELAEKEYTSKGNLSVKMGFLIGLAVFILLV